MLCNSRPLWRLQLGNRLSFHLVPDVTKQTSTSDDRDLLPDSCKINRTSFDLPLLSFRLVSILLFFPNTWSVFISLRSDSSAAPSRISDIFLPTEMGKQKERMFIILDMLQKEENPKHILLSLSFSVLLTLSADLPFLPPPFHSSSST
ncbi:hypothetical protein CNBB4740 [Cryptococcus deneoformans B-3501A]|uniref:hypothetical protein n=1 Tax=Cryptococcus deneoformans (strain B-3501A) TaxID=283643 RepID=UPI000042F010|nr:hypothetical protein CNBB4740 [Cryptococcus neoformans var. neoformans B-3501A]EAL22299.1 hypothetical protein CNBB4740 [Cryptococcus neoformans var. neoformans B-3501A]